jgi:hypothetical protein
MRYLVVKELLTLAEHMSSLSLFDIVLSVLLLFMASDYTLSSFKLFVAF